MSTTSRHWRTTSRCRCRLGCAKSTAPTTGRRGPGTGWYGYRGGGGGGGLVARKSTSDLRRRAADPHADLVEMLQEICRVLVHSVCPRALELFLSVATR